MMKKGQVKRLDGRDSVGQAKFVESLSESPHNESRHRAFSRRAARFATLPGRESTERGTHNIAQPTHVRIEQAESGADKALQVESGGGVTTLVWFRLAVLPEMVDGVVFE